jgi:hypothetical protein
LNFLARHVVDALPGSEAMDAHGEMIGTLNKSTGAPTGSTYFAVASNYSPTKNVLARIADLGLDAFFDMANDLVVPCEGSWKVAAHSTLVGGAQINFGPVRHPIASYADAAEDKGTETLSTTAMSAFGLIGLGM